MNRRNFVLAGAATVAGAGGLRTVAAQQATTETPGTRFRVSRPTGHLDQTVAFYVNGLGFTVAAHFEKHGGYSGTVLRKSGSTLELEFTEAVVGGAPSAPSPDDLLAIYLPDAAAYKAAIAQIEAQGHMPTEPLNPYWKAHGLTFRDPDGWHIFLGTGN